MVLGERIIFHCGASFANWSGKNRYFFEQATILKKGPKLFEE